MASQFLEYKDMKIRADATLGWDGWHWCYSIDGGPTHYSRYGPSCYQHVAMAEVIAAELALRSPPAVDEAVIGPGDS
jgi:hypothetical protein